MPRHPEWKIFIMSTGTMIRKVSVQYHSIAMKFYMDTHRVCWSVTFCVFPTTEDGWRSCSFYQMKKVK